MSTPELKLPQYLSRRTTTVGLNPTHDVTSSNPGEPVFINLDFLPGNTAATYPGNMSHYLHRLFVNVGSQARLKHKHQCETTEPFCVLHEVPGTCINNEQFA